MRLQYGRYEEDDRRLPGVESRFDPIDVDYLAIGGLSNEARQRLAEARPGTLGQAARIPGITPAAISILMIHLKRRGRAA